MKRFEIAETHDAQTVSGAIEPQVNEATGPNTVVVTQAADRVARPRILARRIARAERRATR